MDTRVLLPLILLVVHALTVDCQGAGVVPSTVPTTTGNGTSTNNTSSVTSQPGGDGGNGASGVWMGGAWMMLTLGIALLVRRV